MQDEIERKHHKIFTEVPRSKILEHCKYNKCKKSLKLHRIPDDSNQEDTMLSLAKLSYECETSTNGALLIKSISISTNLLLLHLISETKKRDNLEL